MVKVVFWQENYNGPSEDRPLPIVKTLEQCGRGSSPNELTVKLTKEETLRFLDDRKAYAQIQGKTAEQTAFASKQELINVYPVYDDSILDDDITPTPVPDADGIVILDGQPIS
jgi:hypothetical protein